jgi:glutamine synthetase
MSHHEQSKNMARSKTSQATRNRVALHRDGSAAHVHFEITTRAGNRAMIKGDRYMPETTMRAIATMIDTLAQAINRGEVKPPNE